jgi:hypothetical protein
LRSDVVVVDGLGYQCGLGCTLDFDDAVGHRVDASFDIFDLDEGGAEADFSIRRIPVP